MARGNRGRSSRGRRRRGRGRVASTNTSLSRPLISVRPKNFRHTKAGHGVITTSARRKLTAYPVNSETGKSYIMDLLKWAGRSVLSLLAQKATVQNEDLIEYMTPEEIKRFLGDQFALDGNAEVVQPLGAFTSWFLGPEDLLAEHPGLSLLSKNDTEKRVWNTIHYESGRIDWLQVSVHPGVAMSSREGQIALAVQPVPSEGGDFKHLRSFHDILTLPKSVCGEASRPLTVTWSPTIRDAGMSWRNIGSTTFSASDSPAIRQYTEPDGGAYTCAVYFGYSAHADGEPGAGHYAPSSASFSVYIDGHVSLRTPTNIASSTRVTVRGLGEPKIYTAGIHGECTPTVITDDIHVIDPHGRRILLVHSDTYAELNSITSHLKI